MIDDSHVFLLLTILHTVGERHREFIRSPIFDANPPKCDCLPNELVEVHVGLIYLDPAHVSVGCGHIGGIDRSFG